MLLRIGFPTFLAISIFVTVNAMMRATLLTVLLATQIALSVATFTRVATEHGILTLKGHQKRGVDTHIEGAFRSTEGDGIRFRSSPGSVEITTTDGQNLMKVFSLPVMVQTYGGDEETVVYQILDSAYAEINNVLYHVSSSDAEMALAQGPVSHSQLLAILQARKVYDPQVTAQASIDELVNHRAIRLIEPAAKGLGEDLGIIGKDNPAVMPFYSVGMKIAEAYSQNQRAMVSRNPWAAYRLNNRVTVQGTFPFCDLFTCPPCQEDDCMGLCGKDCSCWSWVCGDCCLHQGCATHDVCCRNRKFWHYKCFAPVALKCDEYYSC